MAPSEVVCDFCDNKYPKDSGGYRVAGGGANGVIICEACYEDSSEDSSTDKGES